LGRSDAAVGQWVLAGEPVGAMGSPQDGKAQLYVELRRDGHPIDPAPWLGKSDTNVE
jgi:septal ring factor EnvC (AmiA/AmiB activator)